MSGEKLTRRGVLSGLAGLFGVAAVGVGKDDAPIAREASQCTCSGPFWDCDYCRSLIRDVVAETPIDYTADPTSKVETGPYYQWETTMDDRVRQQRRLPDVEFTAEMAGPLEPVYRCEGTIKFDTPEQAAEARAELKAMGQHPNRATITVLDDPYDETQPVDQEAVRKWVEEMRTYRPELVDQLEFMSGQRWAPFQKDFVELASRQAKAPNMAANAPGRANRYHGQDIGVYNPKSKTLFRKARG